MKLLAARGAALLTGLVFALVLSWNHGVLAGTLPPPLPLPSPQACVDVANETSYWMPGELKAPGMPSASFHFEANRITRACLQGPLASGTPLIVVIKSGWGMPIGACRLMQGANMRIERHPDHDGVEQTRLVCR